MLTENDARALLTQAAETIEVGHAFHVEPVRRRAWPVLAAAVATVVAGVGVWAGVAATDDTDAAPDPSVDPAEVEPGTVPSVFGHRREEATRILTDAGLEVRVVERPACDPPGQAIGTLPSTGVRMEPGSVVTLQVAAEGLTMDCYSELTVPWQLLGLATGELASPPLLQGSLTAYLDGERRTVPDASDLDAWGSPSALDALRAAVEWSPEVPRDWRTLESEPGCDGVGVPFLDGTTPIQRYAIDYDAADAPCVQLTVTGEFGKRPVEVAVETAGLEVGDKDSADVSTTTVPAVFGLTEGEALKALQDAGVGKLVSVAEPGCLEPGRALGTEPAAGTPLSSADPVRLTVTSDYQGANCALTDRPFWSLLDFARGGRPPAFADEVTTFVDGVASTESDPATLRTWAAGSPLEALLAVAGDARPGFTDERVLRTGVSDLFPRECDVDGVEGAQLPPGFDGPSTTQTWFTYQRDDEIRACIVIDLRLDVQGRIDALAVRTVDPDGLLPTLAAQPVSAEVSDLVSVLVAFATGEWNEPPDLADGVALYDAGDYVRTASAAELVERTAWLVCDPAVRDTCVGSALEALAYAVGEVPSRSTEQVPSGAPDGTVSVVTVGPPEVTGCQLRGTVTLYVDAEEQIVGVDVANVPVRTCGEEGLVPPE